MMLTRIWQLPSRTSGFLAKRGRILLDAAAPDAVRQRQRARALAALRDVTFSSLTFVCQGNINRSAVAERRLAADNAAAGLTVRSCGLHMRGGRASPALSIAAAAQLGVDLAQHRSSVATDLPPTGTLLVGFEPHHLRAWQHMAERESSAVLLGVFDDDSNAHLLIPDPYNRDMSYTTAVFQRVIACVDALAGRLETINDTHWRVRT
jgi:protein-tyrosine-phosphatase